MKISLIYSNDLLTQSIDFYVDSIDEKEILKKYVRIIRIKAIQFETYKLIDIIADSEAENVKMFINAHQYNL